MQPQFVGPSYNLESRPASVQRTVNLVPVPMEPGNERAGWGLEDVPGLTELELVQLHGCYITENFEDGLGAYTTVSGDPALFTTGPDSFGSALHCAVQTVAAVSAIRRVFAAITCTRLVVRFRVDGDGSDDTAGLACNGSSVQRFTVVPRREAAIDPERGCEISLLGETVRTDAPVAFGAWYQVDIAIAPGAGQSTWRVTNLATGVVFQAGAFAGDLTNVVFDEMQFRIDAAPGNTCPTSYDSICLGF